MSINYKQLVENRNMGRVRVSLHAMDNLPDMVQHGLSKLLIMNAECNYAIGELTYYAFGESFAPVTMGEIVPLYDLDIITNEKGEFENCQFHKVS
jgi:hypothetical protein